MITPFLSYFRLLSGSFFLVASGYIHCHIRANGKTTNPRFGHIVMAFTMLAGIGEILGFLINLFPQHYVIGGTHDKMLPNLYLANVVFVIEYVQII